MKEIKPGKDIKISDDGRYVITGFSPTEIAIWKYMDTYLKMIAIVNRFENTDFYLNKNDLIYVRNDGAVVKMHYFDTGLIKEEVEIKNPILALIGYKDNGEAIIFKMSELKMLLIKNYIIKYDSISGKALLICKHHDGKFRTVIINNGKVDCDRSDIFYKVKDLSLIQFYDGIIFIPSHGKIIAFSLEKCITQDLYCAQVDYGSQLKFYGKSLEVINGNCIYKIHKIKDIMKNLK